MVIEIVPGVAIDEAWIEERFVRAAGPGGQNVNKVSTAVELRLDLSRAAWPEEVRARVRRLAGQRMTTGGVLVIQAREHRTQGQNREAARARMIELVRRAAIRPKRRRPTRPSAGSKERRLTEKRLRSMKKQTRSRGRDE